MGLEDNEISAILNSDGPIVKCVLIKSEMEIEEVVVDTTPSKREVEGILGGPITFLGQYVKSGVVAMTVKDGFEVDIVLPAPLDDLEIKGNVLLMKVSKEDDDDF